MGRTIPSISARLERKFVDWKGFEECLPNEDRKIYRELAETVKNFRAAISESGEYDLAVPILLAMLISVKKGA
jgi:hypothetical protein